MIPHTRRVLFYGLLLASGAGSLGAAPAAGAPHGIASDLPASERLIAALPATNTLFAPAAELFEWPSPETLESQKAREDRSQTLPPLFRQPKVRDAKPIRLGARSPQAACKEAEQWIRRVLKPEWVPDDLAARLRSLQREPASRSVIVCRYALDGTAIQISQSRGSMWVVIRPSKPLSTNASQAGVAAFNTYFFNGDSMAALGAREIAGTAKLRAWRPDYASPVPPGALENWWGWRLLATDGNAVAVLLDKTSEDSAHTVTPDEPWF